MLSKRFAKIGSFIGEIRDKNSPLNQEIKRKYEASLNDDSSVAQRSKYFTAIYLWFMAITVFYTSVKFTVPYVIGEVFGYDWWIAYWWKVAVGFGFIQITANWTCIRCFTSYYEETEDKPQLRKTLWDEHPEETVAKHAERKKTDEGLESDATSMANAAERGHGRWKYCVPCQRDAPPRSHHCKVCRKCTLKRDHHCFIVGACIGYYNQRYFVMLTFYLLVFSVYSLFLAYFYLRDKMWDESSALDYFLPYTFYQWLITGAQPLQHFLIMCQLYTFTWIGPMCLSFFSLQMLLITTGKTMQEYTHNLPIKVTSKISENFQSVFGAFWPFNFLMPAAILFRQPGDGIHWSKIYTLVRRRVPECIAIKIRSQ